MNHLFVDTTVDVWSACLDVTESLHAQYANFLDPRERLRVERLRRDIDRRHYVVSHGILREILGAYLQIAPGDVVFEYGPFGKPFVGQAGAGRLEFNMSDSAGMLLVAATQGAAVGVDIEKRRPIDVVKFARRFFAKSEADWLDGLPEVEREAQFFRLWTCKEAYVKGWGYGIQRHVGRFEVRVTGGRSELVRCAFDESSPRRWSLVDISSIDGFAATVAVERSGVSEVFLREWSGAECF